MDFSDEMREKYPLMYTHGVVECDSGWNTIILTLSEEIQSYLNWKNRNNVSVPQVVVDQVKEKFGSLRFYYTGGDDYVTGLVDMAEQWALHTCEVCGKTGEIRNLPWIKTLCGEHFEERKKRYETLNGEKDAK